MRTSGMWTALLGAAALALVHVGAAAPPAISDVSSATWLEESRGKAALEWVSERNRRTLAELQSDARFNSFYEEALRIAASPERIPAATPFDGWRYGDWVYNLWTDAAHPKGLLRRTRSSSYEAADPQWQPVLDLDALDAAEHRNWLLRQMDCLAPRFERCMLSLSEGGQEALVYREFDTRRLAFVSDGFSLSVPVRVSLVAWKDENTLLVSTTDGGGAATRVGFPATLRMWRRGQPLSAAREVYRATPESLVVDAKTYPNSRGDLITIVRDIGADLRSTHWSIDAAGKLKALALPPAYGAIARFDDQWVFILSADWTVAGHTWKQGSVVAVPLEPVAEPRVRLLLEPGERETWIGVQAARDGVVAVGISNVQGRLVSLRFEKDTWSKQAVSLPTDGSIHLGMAATPDADEVYVRYEGFVQPLTLYGIRAGTGATRVLRKVPEQFDSSRYVVEQRHVASKDGVLIPYFEVRSKRFRASGTAPTLLYGYGAHGSVEQPKYSGALGKLWLDRGGVYGVANVRGGGELGESWHQAGMKALKQHSYDDLIAVAEDLIRRGVTSPRHLGLRGMSSGGLLMAAVLNQRPELFRAAVIEVALLDLFRFDLLQGGDGFAREFGSAAVPEERAFLERTSPFQNLQRRPGFPRPLLITSTADDRVLPAQTRRYAAKMDLLGLPYLYYETAEGGHEIAISPGDKAMLDAIVFTYLSRELSDAGAS